MIASTNDAYCPTLRAVTKSALPEGVNSVLEIVVNGVDAASIATSMRAGIDAACRPGVIAISAGNYGGKLGPHHFHLREIMTGVTIVSDGMVARLRSPLQQRADFAEVLAGSWPRSLRETWQSAGSISKAMDR